MASQGKASQGKARQGMAGHGGARRGKAWQDKVSSLERIGPTMDFWVASRHCTVRQVRSRPGKERQGFTVWATAHIVD